MSCGGTLSSDDEDEYTTFGLAKDRSLSKCPALFEVDRGGFFLEELAGD